MSSLYYVEWERYPAVNGALLVSKHMTSLGPTWKGLLSDQYTVVEELETW